MTISAAASVPPGNYPLTITGASTGAAGNLSHSAAVTLVVAQPAPDFTITPAAQTLSVQAGSSATLQIAIAALNGFAGNVTFVVSGLPAGATTNFNPASVPGTGSTTLTIAADASTLAGSFPLTITASGTGPNGPITHSAAVALTVTTAAPGTPDFSISATPPTATIHAGQTASYSISASALNGFSGPVTLACSGLPAAATCSFNPNPLAPASNGATATLQIATAGTTAALGGISRQSGFAFLATVGFSLFGICLIGGSGELNQWRIGRLSRESAQGGRPLIGSSKRGRSSRRVSNFWLAVLLALTLIAIGCGTVSNHNQQSGGAPAPATPAGTYNVSIIASSGSLQHSTSVQLIVQ
jgi:uncharacterized membrane protein